MDMASQESLYHDSGQVNVKSMKSKMTLDFQAPPAKKPALSVPGLAPAALLQSPDLQLLKLASPELERMIIQNNNMVTTTPTPTSVMYPKNVTEEQEAYARGFVDALAELYKKSDAQQSTIQTSAAIVAQAGEPVLNVPTVVTGNAANIPTVVSSATPNCLNMLKTEQAPTYTTLNNAVMPSTVNLSAISSNRNVMMSTASSVPMMSTSQVPQNVPLVAPSTAFMSDDSRTNSPLVIEPFNTTSATMRIKEEPQTVPCSLNTVSPPPSNPDLLPIDMNAQEAIKVERKRARNRQAARKCRTRKLERISKLEERVDELKGQNSELVNTAANLRQQVCELKQQILHHVQSGCKVMVQPSTL